VLGIHGPEDDLNLIKAEIAKGNPVIVGLIKWDGLSVGGHTVLAYDTHPLGDGRTVIDVYNPNVPYKTAEQSDAAKHDLREFTHSQIIYDHGNWTFPEGADFKGSNGQPWTGSEADMVVYKHDDLPIINGQQPKLPNLFVAGAMVVFGSGGDGATQVSDSAGGTLFNGSGLAARSSWPQGVAPLPPLTGSAAPLQELAVDPARAHPLTATVSRGAGGGGVDVRLPGLQAALQVGAAPGTQDHVTVDPHADTVTYAGGAHPASLSGTLISAPGAGPLAERTVSFRTTTAQGSDRLGFPRGRELSLRHTGAPATLTLTLSAFAPDGRPLAVTLPPIRLARGETLTVTPRRWSALDTATVLVTTTTRGRTRKQLVHGRSLAKAFARPTKVTLTGAGGLDLTLALHRPPAGASISAAATIQQGGRTVAVSVPARPQTPAATLHLTLRTRPPAGRRYTVKLRLLETTANGAVQASKLVTYVGSASPTR
jgi:hypothetical protein